MRHDTITLKIEDLCVQIEGQELIHNLNLTIPDGEVHVLQSRGMDEREAISLIIRGFLGADVFGLGAELDDRIEEIAELAGHGEA